VPRYTVRFVDFIATCCSPKTGDSTITPAVLANRYDIRGNKVKSEVRNPTSGTVLSFETWEYDYLGNPVKYFDTDTDDTERSDGPARACDDKDISC